MIRCSNTNPNMRPFKIRLTLDIERVFIEVRLQKPCVYSVLCIGCGICENTTIP
jgi:hypothetical protein